MTWSTLPLALLVTTLVWAALRFLRALRRAIGMRMLSDLIKDFERQFPGECGLCSYARWSRQRRPDVPVAPVCPRCGASRSEILGGHEFDDEAS